MKIGVISDTHIPERAQKVPEGALRAFRGCDMIIHAGDLVDVRVFDELVKVCPDVKGVAGNMDQAAIRKKFPEKVVMKVGKFMIGVKHGFGPPDKLLELMRESFKQDNVDVVIFGHSHQPLVLRQEGILFFNPGSATDDIFAPYKSVGILEIGDTIEGKIIKL